MLSFEEIWSYFKNDTFAVDLVGIVPEEISAGRVVCSLGVKDHHKNADGKVMGGVSYTLGDFAFALFANRHKIGTVTLSASIRYLGVCKGEKLIATVTPIKEGRSVVNAEVMITDEFGNAVAHMVADGFRKN